MKLRVTSDAKQSAREGLKQRKEAQDKFGLDRYEAEKEGIQSGVERARQIIQQNYFDWNDPDDRKDLKSMKAFYARFQNCRTEKCEGALKLWGGRWWLRNRVTPFVEKMSKR